MFRFAHACVSLFAIHTPPDLLHAIFHSPKLLYVYWRVIRIIIFYVMVVLGQGVVSLFSAIQGIYLMKFPDLYIEEHHKHPRFGNERYSPNAYFNSMALCMLLVSAIAMGLLMPSFALTFKNVMSHRMTCKLQSAADKAYRLNLKRLSSGTPLNRSTSKGQPSTFQPSRTHDAPPPP